MIIVNTENISGMKIIESKGLVQGNLACSATPGFKLEIKAMFRTLVRGELEDYTELLTAGRQEVFNRMSEQAKELGANAVICVRFEFNNTWSVYKFYAYGTAVVAVPEKE